MANVTRFDPFQIADPFDDVFKGFFRPMRSTAPAQMQIRMDVTEDDRHYRVHAEIPGVKKDDIHVTIDGNQVAITAETRQEKDIKDGEVLLRSERYYGKVSRSFQVENDIDETAAQAKYQDGVLELTLPKKVTASARKLVVQ